VLKKIVAGLLGLLALVLIVLAAWYQIDGQPLQETGRYLNGAGYRATQADDGSFLFEPDAGHGLGLLIMHGALIKPQSYVNTAAYFAQRGYTVLIPSGTARLSINAVNHAVERMNEFELDGWFMIGHSMGGFSVLTLIERHAPDVAGVALWASAQPVDFSGLSIPMLFIWGDNDGLLPAGRFADTQRNLPVSVEFVTLEGANHRDFAMYSHQFFDNEGKLGWARQIDFANQRTAEFFTAVMRDKTGY